jgi:hypothetical protein
LPSHLSNVLSNLFKNTQERNNKAKQKTTKQKNEKVVPTSVITLVAVTGFFTPASTSTERREKLSLGIDSLLAMSILMMMVSEQMPTFAQILLFFIS